MTGYEATVQVGVFKTMGRAPSEGVGISEGHDSVPTREEGLRKRGLVYHYLKGKHRDRPGSICLVLKYTNLLSVCLHTYRRIYRGPLKARASDTLQARTS